MLRQIDHRQIRHGAERGEHQRAQQGREQHRCIELLSPGARGARRAQTSRFRVSHDEARVWPVKPERDVTSARRCSDGCEAGFPEIEGALSEIREAASSRRASADFPGPGRRSAAHHRNFAAGNVDSTTALVDAASGNNPRSAVSTNGVDFWFAGASGGVRYTTLGSSTSSQLSTTVANLRQVQIFGSQLFVFDSSGSAVRLGAVGAGVPMVSGQTIVNLPGISAGTGSPYGFFFADLDVATSGLDTLYIADDSIGLSKYSLVAGVWTSNGSIGSSADAYRGLTGIVLGQSVTLFATRKGGSAAAGGGELVSLVDASGYNGAFSSAPSILATSSVNTAFRGVALAAKP